MLHEHTATTLPSGGSALGRTWESPASWRYVRTLWVRISQLVRARRANRPDDMSEPDPFASHVPFLTDTWPGHE